MSAWNMIQFSELFRQSPKLAFEYREKTLWTKLSKQEAMDNNIEFLEEWESTQTTVDEFIETKESDENIEVTREWVIEKLKTAWIVYFKWAKTEKLIELCIENNLL